MFASSSTSTRKGEIADLFAGDSEQKKTHKRKSSKQKQRRLLYRKLHEVIYGHRSALKVYSNILQSDVWIINEGLVDPHGGEFDGIIITMEMLAGIVCKNKNIAAALKKLAI